MSLTREAVEVTKVCKRCGKLRLCGGSVPMTSPRCRCQRRLAAIKQEEFVFDHGDWWMICARCKKEWTGDPLFITCVECRIPFKPGPKSKAGCRRFNRAYERGGDSYDPSPMNENIVRHLEE